MAQRSRFKLRLWLWLRKRKDSRGDGRILKRVAQDARLPGKGETKMNPTRQEQALKFIRGYIESNSEAPTIVEIGRQIGYRSTSDVHKVLVSLEREGRITRTRQWRSIKLAQ